MKRCATENKKRNLNVMLGKQKNHLSLQCSHLMKRSENKNSTIIAGGRSNVFCNVELHLPGDVSQCPLFANDGFWLGGRRSWTNVRHTALKSLPIPVRPVPFSYVFPGQTIANPDGLNGSRRDFDRFRSFIISVPDKQRSAI